MLVEFWGTPGAGKTTLAQLVLDALRRRGVPATNALEKRSRIMIQLERTLGALSCCVCFPKASAAAVSFIKASQQRSLRDLRPVLIRWLAAYGRFRLCHNRRRLVVTDEGLVQAFWSIRYSASREVSWPLGIPGDLPSIPRWLIIEIRTADDLLATRLLSRRWQNSRLTADLAADRNGTLARAAHATSATRQFISTLAKDCGHEFTAAHIDNTTDGLQPVAEHIAEWAIRTLHDAPG
jgi:hypothetical protein